MQIAQLVETFVIAIVASYSLVPLIRKLAFKFAYVDHPTGHKVHAHPIPLLGGVAIFVAFLIAVLTKKDLLLSGHVQAILGGCIILLVIGLIDDRMGMMPNIKLLGQFLAAIAVVKAGVRVEFFNSYYPNVIFSYLWIVGITNAFNLLDNMNGLSAGIAAIAALFLGAIAYMSGQGMVAALSFALAGAALGFLRYNFPKATIFMGDAGSLILGYLLATLAILAQWKTASWTTGIMIPLLILGYPIFDTTLVTIMRVLQKRSIFQGGKDHSSHRLALLGFKRMRAVLVIYGVCALLGLAAIAVATSYGMKAILYGLVALGIMAALGIRLSLVDTGRYGRRKGAHGS